MVPDGFHVGSESILKIIKEKKPRAVLFGHVHEQVGNEKLGTTELIKLPAANSMRGYCLKVKDKSIMVQIISL